MSSRNTRISALIAAVAILLPQPVLSNTAQDLENFCRESVLVTDASTLTDKDLLFFVRCKTYIEAVAETLYLASAVIDDSESFTEIVSCLPKETNWIQLARVVKKYIGENPEHLHLNGSEVIWLAINNAWC